MFFNDILITLLFIQVLMGALDTFIHHEFGLNLAWDLKQRTEIKLHGIRNILYGVFFGFIAFGYAAGFWAWALMALLAVELVITLIDFVEEDRTRLLPASERVMHTLMALNYGAILALMIPILWAAAMAITSLELRLPTGNHVWHLLWLCPAVAGVTILGIKDILSSFRLQTIFDNQQEPSMIKEFLPILDQNDTKHILITGATGFVGSRLTAACVEAGHRVTILTRHATSASHLPPPLRIITDLDDIHADEKIDAIINLAGESVSNNLWTRKFQRKVLFSRMRLVKKIGKLCARLRTPPETIISASAIGIYGAQEGKPIDPHWTEDMPIPDDGTFVHRSNIKLERFVDRLSVYGSRIVHLRVGLVLDRSGGVLSKLLPPFGLGLGGPFGHGRQYMSWISRDDLVRMIGFAMARQDIRGPLNGVSPKPIRNADFAKNLGKALHRPSLIPMPAFVLNLTGAMGRELFLNGAFILPKKAKLYGFTWQDDDHLQFLQENLGQNAAQARKSKVKSPQKV